MTDETNTPKFPEKKVDDLIASHGREPEKPEMNMITAMIEKERMKQKIRQQMAEQKIERKLNRGKGRSR